VWGHTLAFHFQKFSVIIVYVFVMSVSLSTVKKKSLGYHLWTIRSTDGRWWMDLCGKTLLANIY